MPLLAAPARRATNASVPTEFDRELSSEEPVAAKATLAVPVWDLPVRLFHWGIVALIAFSWWSAEYNHTQWHLYSGYLALFALLFRLAWGVIGSSTARFAGFIRGPRAVMRYLGGGGSEQPSVGHTPIGALSVIALLALIGAQIGFGLFLVNEDGDYAGPLARLVSDDTSELARTVHLTLFNVLLGFIILHVLAILFYRFWRGKKLLGPMVGGTSTQYPASTVGMVKARRSALIFCLAIAAALTGWIIAGAPPF